MTPDTHKYCARCEKEINRQLNADDDANKRLFEEAYKKTDAFHRSYTRVAKSI